MKTTNLDTSKVLGAKRWKDLKAVLIEFGSVTQSYREDPHTWTAERLIYKMEEIRAGRALPQFITRELGIRAKVCELIMTNNYNDPWD
jgi:hypothetical protein